MVVSPASEAATSNIFSPTHFDSPYPDPTACEASTDVSFAGSETEVSKHKNQMVGPICKETALRPRTAIELVNNKGGGVLCGDDSAKSTRLRNPATCG